MLFTRATLGNRPDLFGGTVKTYTDTTYPKNIWRTKPCRHHYGGEKYLGYPYNMGRILPGDLLRLFRLCIMGYQPQRLGRGRSERRGFTTSAPRYPLLMQNPATCVFFVGTYDTPAFPTSLSMWATA